MILSIQAWILVCSISVQHLIYASSKALFEVIEPFFVVSLFIQNQVGSIIFKSGELGGQSSLEISYKSKTSCWYREECDGAPSSCTIVPGLSFKHSFAKGISLGFKISSWYRYQFIPPLPSFNI